MPHVEIGELHAYLDGAFGDASEEARRIARHVEECAECNVMLQDEQRIRARASSILGAARPALETVPPFEQVLDRGREIPLRRWNPQHYAWAASVVLALGLGWFGNELVRRKGVQEFESARTESAAQDAVSSATTQTAAPPPAPPPQPERDARSDMAVRRGSVGGGVSAPPVTASGNVTAAPTVPLPINAPPPTVQMAQQQQVAADQARAAAGFATPLRESRVLADSVLQGKMTMTLRTELQWRDTTIAEAERKLGREVLLVPELELVSVALSPLDTTIVRVVQRLPSGAALEIIQQAVADQQNRERERSEVGQGARGGGRGGGRAIVGTPAAESVPISTAMVVHDRIALTGRAPISTDSLRILLSRARRD